MISSQMLSSRCALRAITYSGPIAATIGSIFVDMKKNSASRQPLTERTDSAYAAGSPSSSTRIVEPTVAIAECSMYGPMPLNTSRNSASVGLNVNLGGHVSAADSGLKAVITIHSTGTKNAIPTTQPSTVQPAIPETSRGLRPRRAGGAVVPAASADEGIAVTPVIGP